MCSRIISSSLPVDFLALIHVGWAWCYTSGLGGDCGRTSSPLPKSDDDGYEGDHREEGGLVPFRAGPPGRRILAMGNFRVEYYQIVIWHDRNVNPYRRDSLVNIRPDFAASYPAILNNTRPISRMFSVSNDKSKAYDVTLLVFTDKDYHNIGNAGLLSITLDGPNQLPGSLQTVTLK
ncbi:hypothetical protein PT974_07784 [Cladobotryum mycophilum]|uniref:Malectin-like domain-containing protein n=1 Tax=Cladobotryum mycophilum TaxID=491253 RepID=A0ABR0SHZ4_9HYPO